TDSAGKLSCAGAVGRFEQRSIRVRGVGFGGGLGLMRAVVVLAELSCGRLLGHVGIGRWTGLLRTIAVFARHLCKRLVERLSMGKVGKRTRITGRFGAWVGASCLLSTVGKQVLALVG